MKETIRFTYERLCLTRNDIEQIYSLLGGKDRINYLAAGNYDLESIDELDKITYPILSDFTLIAHYPPTDKNKGILESFRDSASINFNLTRHYASLSLNNSEHLEAFRRLHKAHELLQTKDIGNSPDLLKDTPHNVIILREQPKVEQPKVEQPKVEQPKNLGFFARHKDQFAAKAVEIIMTVVLTAIVTGGIIGPISYYLGKGQQQPTIVKQQTPASSTTQPTTAPVTKPTK